MTRQAVVGEFLAGGTQISRKIILKNKSDWLLSYDYNIINVFFGKASNFSFIYF